MRYEACNRYQAREMGLKRSGQGTWWGVWDDAQDRWVHTHSSRTEAKAFARIFQSGYDSERENSGGGACFDD